MNALERIAELKLLPVIRIADLSDAVPLADALIGGGLPAAEITFRTECAAEAIFRIRNAFPEMLVGAGTVLSIDQAKSAAAAGAGFIVSPGSNPAVIGYCTENGIPIVPGCVTPSEIETAMSLGIGTVKFFPAEAYGGVRTISALSAPYRNIRFIPTGGINESNLLSYLKCPSVIACGGSFMAEPSLIEGKRFDSIREATKKAVTLISEG